MVVRDYNPYLGYKNDVISAHKALAVKIAQRFKWAVNHHGLSFDDLLSEAYIGLIKAFDRYDPERFGGKVTKFSTYAVPMMQGEIRRFLRDRSSLLKVPRDLYLTAGQILKHDLAGASASDVAEKLGLNEEDAFRVIRYLHESNISSIDQSVRSSKNRDNDLPLLSEIIHVHDDHSAIFVSDFLNTLADREREAIEMRLEGAVQSEIASKLGISQMQTSRILHSVGNKFKNYMEMEVRAVEVEEITKEKYLKMKEQNMSDEKICSLFKIGSSALYNRKRKWNLSANTVKSKPVKEHILQVPKSESSAALLCTEKSAPPSFDDKKQAAALERIDRLERENGLLKALLKNYL